MLTPDNDGLCNLRRRCGGASCKDRKHLINAKSKHEVVRVPAGAVGASVGACSDTAAAAGGGGDLGSVNACRRLKLNNTRHATCIQDLLGPCPRAGDEPLHLCKTHARERTIEMEKAKCEMPKQTRQNLSEDHS